MRFLWLLALIGVVVLVLRSVRSTDRDARRRRDDDEDPPDEDIWAAIDRFK